MENFFDLLINYLFVALVLFLFIAMYVIYFKKDGVKEKDKSEKYLAQLANSEEIKELSIILISL